MCPGKLVPTGRSGALGEVCFREFEEYESETCCGDGDDDDDDDGDAG